MLEYFKIKEGAIIDIKISSNYYVMLTSLISRMLSDNPELITKVPKWIETRSKGELIEAENQIESDAILLIDLAGGMINAAKSQGLIENLSKEDYEKAMKANAEQASQQTQPK